MTREKVLEIGYEGGGFELFAELDGGVPARFFFVSGGRSMFGDEFDEPRADHGPLTWEEVLAQQLEPNGWLRLCPMFVHPALLPRVRAATDVAPYRVGDSWRSELHRVEHDSRQATKMYVLLGADGKPHESATPGTLGGNGKQRVYGKLTCGSARSAIRRWGEAYTRTRVFFADEATAIAAGYRPCGNCMRPAYAEWKKRRTGGRETTNTMSQDKRDDAPKVEDLTEVPLDAICYDYNGHPAFQTPPRLPKLVTPKGRFSTIYDFEKFSREAVPITRAEFDAMRGHGSK